jgi:hypothetical protein
MNKHEKSYTARTTKLFGEFLRWWVLGVDDEMVLSQAGAYNPHLYTGDHGEVAKQRLDAWVRRGWVWVIKDEEQATDDTGWLKLVIRVRLTEDGRDLIEALQG